MSTPWQARVAWRSKALQFIINHNTGGTIGVYPRKMEARQGMANCQQDELLLEAAKALLEKAVSAFDANASHWPRSGAWLN